MTTNTTNPAGAYASVNGINLYYEIHGTGTPLIMLHGGFGTFDMFSALSPTLALSHQIIGVDLYGHGHTALTDRPIHFEQMADYNIVFRADLLLPVVSSFLSEGGKP